MKRFLFLAFIFMAQPALAQNILYIGDSHSYVATLSSDDASKRFGNVFIQEFKARKIKLSYYSACGSSPQSWVTGSRTECGFTSYDQGEFISLTQATFASLTQILRPQEHTGIIVNLGDNMFNWKVTEGKRLATLGSQTIKNKMSGFLKALSGKDCIWIGPTYHATGSIYDKPDAIVDEFYAQLEVELKGTCRLIDSRSFVPKGHAGDGLHHNNADSRLWAEGVLSTLFL
jgi:hypothetical protein